MSFRDKLRKFKSETKSRIFQTDEAKSGTDAAPGQSSIPSTPKTPHIRTSLGTLLRKLEQATRPLAPLSAIIVELAECVDQYENVLRDRKEYETLCRELEGLFQALQVHCAQSAPPTITITVEALCKAIENEIADIRAIQAKEKRRKYFETEQDMDAVLACYRRIQSYLQRISLNANISVWRIVDDVTTDNRLKHLSPSLSACYNSAQAVELKRGPCAEGTRLDLLSQMLNWVENFSSGSVYWISGMAGTGKTTIAYSLCEELNARHKLAASFFCSRLLPECRNVNLIIPSIAYQLARSSHPFRFVLSKVLEKDPDVHTRLPNLQFEALVSKPLLEVKDTLPDNFIVIVDALDECENKESTSRILDVLLTKTSNLPVKFIVSSRPEPEIRDEMTKQHGQAESRVVLHELDKHTVKEDIETYLRITLKQIQPTDDQISILVERAGILFIYAATAVRYISHDRFRRNPHARLANVLNSSSISENKYKEIDELYTVILRAALDDPSLDNNEAEDMRQILHSVICTREPLTVGALSKLLKMNNPDRVRTALRPLWSVLHISGVNELVATLHASFPDYMLDPSRSKQYHCDTKVHNQIIAHLCFDCLRDVRPQFNICQLESSYVSDSEVLGLDERVEDRVPTELFYICRYWAVHLHFANGTPDLISELEEFLSVRLLLWMEIMNLKKCAGAMPQAIRLVETWEVERSAELNALIHDAWRFTSTFTLGAATTSTPHIYISMLPFWPESSPIFNCYARHPQRMIQTEGSAIEKRQHTHLATWALGSGVFSSAFSPDGTIIAVGSGYNLELLNSSTGRMMSRLFQQDVRITSVQFSPDGARIVAGSSRGDIYIWNSRDGELVFGPLEGHTSSISNVAFSPDGARIVSASNDKTYVWNVTSGERMLDLTTGSGISNELVKYSPDGRHIVSYGGDNGILIRDAQTGRVLRESPLDNFPHSIDSIDICPIVTYIAICSDDGSICIWNYVTGQLVLGPLKPPGSPVEQVFFSSDGSRLISGSANGDLCIWDTQSGKLLLRPLEGHTDYITSATFSPDGAYLVSSSADETLRLWDTQTRKTIITGPLIGHTDSVDSIRFSPDGTRIISGSFDHTICAWDTGSGEMVLGPLEKCPQYQIQVAFSPDGAYAVATTDHGVMVLDVRTGDITSSSPWYHQYITAVGLSPDSNYILSGAVDGIVRMSAVDTSQTLLIIHLPLCGEMSTQVDTIAFSPDGAWIAVAFGIGSISIYEAGSGRLQFLHRPIDGGTFSFSPDSTRIVYGTGHNLSVTDVQSGMELLQIYEYTDSIRAVQFSPDASHIISASYDGICIREAQTGQLVFGPVNWDNDLPLSVWFSSDGKRVVSGSEDNVIRVTDIQPIPTATDTLVQGFGEWQMDGQGWVIHHDQQWPKRLLVWIPADLRTALMWPQTKLLISRKGYLRLNFGNACLGEAWTECYRPA